MSLDQPQIDSVAQSVRRDAQDHLLHVRLPLRDQRTHERG